MMTKSYIVVNPELGVEYVAMLFANTHIRRVPVIKGQLLGVISITDIVKVILSFTVKSIPMLLKPEYMKIKLRSQN